MPKTILRAIEATIEKMNEINREGGAESIDEKFSSPHGIDHFSISGVQTNSRGKLNIINLKAHVDPTAYQGVELIDVRTRDYGHGILIVTHDDFAKQFTGREALERAGYTLAQPGKREKEIAHLGAAVEKALKRGGGKIELTKALQTAKIKLGDREVGTIATVEIRGNRILKGVSIDGREHFEPIIAALFERSKREIN